jgi:hypothetical protein
MKEYGFHLRKEEEEEEGFRELYENRDLFLECLGLGFFFL